MKTLFECIPCFINQAFDAAQIAQLNKQQTEDVLREALIHTAKIDLSKPPPLTGRDIQNIVKAKCITDPYLQEKITHTEKALQLLPQMYKVIKDANDPFLAAVKCAIAGNAIDLGTTTDVCSDVNISFENAFHSPIDETEANKLKEEIDNAKSVLYLVDNCGEVIFDRPLMEYIGKEKLIVGVRGKPTINDVTFEDAKRSYIYPEFNVVSNGSDIPGTYLEECDSDFVEIFNNADVIISKGQGNFETLNSTKKSIFFLLLVKCQVIAKTLGKPQGTFIIQNVSHSR